MIKIQHVAKQWVKPTFTSSGYSALNAVN